MRAIPAGDNKLRIDSINRSGSITCSSRLLAVIKSYCLPSATSLSISLPVAFLGIAAAMTAGSLLRSMKVTETLAEKVTKMEPLEGLAANLVTAGLVIFASRLALPVSTTHVSSGAIIGLGLKRDARAIQWKTVREMALAWVVTLPAAAAVASLAFLLISMIP